MNKNTKYIFTLISIVFFPMLLFGQLKVGYVASDRIRLEYEEFKESESQLQLDFQKIQFEYQEMLKELDSLKQAFDTQRLMSSPEWRREKEQNIKDKEMAIQNFQAKKVGPEGELVKKQSQMEYELLSKVKKAVDNVAIEKGYDFIFDGSISLLYGKPTHDLTDDVLHELRKVSSNTPK
ncbi:MAG TPA: OmpH family outer membrane protein [Candidatus Marinimicrobia bacterium]|nr:OmpH family outer membrane protein [Candidatus Neomarinimicrobiota bacterium]